MKSIDYVRHTVDSIEEVRLPELKKKWLPTPEGAIAWRVLAQSISKVEIHGSVGR